jgi:hypothetical protein
VVLSASKWDCVEDVRSFLAAARSGATLPLPGKGETSRRLSCLRAMSARNASLGRLLEAHCDAQAIFADANVAVPTGQAVAVWAISRIVATSRPGGLVLNGTQQFCGGAGVVDGALIAVSSDEGERLVFVRLNQSGVSIDLSTWKAAAFRDASVGTVHLCNVEIPCADMVGNPHFYSSRTGFWWGAVGVAACWAGIADGIMNMHRLQSRKCDEIASVSLGLQTSLAFGIDAVLDFAGRCIDESTGESGRVLALSVRHQVAAAAGQILDALEKEVGPGPLAFDPEWSRATTELRMALGQQHGDRDLRELGDLSRCS